MEPMEKNGVYNGGTDWSQEIGIEGRNIVGFFKYKLSY